MSDYDQQREALIAFREATDAVFDALEARARALQAEIDSIAEKYGVQPRPVRTERPAKPPS